MKSFYSVLKKELKSYIDHPMAYVLAVVFLSINNFLYFRTSLVQEVASMRAMFSLLPWVLLFFISALTMRTWAEERKENTLSVLLSYPVQVWKIILGKFAATSIFVTVILLLTLIIPISLGGVGNFDWGVITGQYIGAILLAFAMIAVGQWSSSLTKNQVISFIISIAVLFGFFFIGLDFVVLALPFPLNSIAQQLGMLAHYNSLTRGVLDLRDLLYLLSVAFVFLALSYAWLTRLKTIKGSKNWRVLQTSIVILIVISVVINLMGQSLTIRADLTEQNLYSLSSATKATLRNLDDTVRLTLYRSQKLPTQIELVSRDVQDILSDYKKFGGRYVDYQIKYPDQDEEVASEAQRAGIPSIRFNVVREDEFTLQEGHLGLLVEYLDQKEVIPFIQTIDDLEYRLTRAFLSLQEDDSRRIGYVSDFGGKDLQTLTTFASALQEEAELVEVSMTPSDPESEEEFTPEISEVDALIIAGPTERFSESAVQAVREYINDGGKIFWMLSGTKVDQTTLTVSKNETGLEGLLANKGITLNQDLVSDLSSHETVNFSQGVFSYLLPYPFWVRSNLSGHVLAGNIQQVVLPWPSSVSVSDDERIQVLLQTTEAGVKQSDGFNINPDAVEALTELEQSQAILGVTMQDINAEESAEQGRWVVIANQNFLDDSMLQQHSNNLGLAMNAIDWLLQNEALLTIRTKSSQAPVLTWESNQQQSLIKWGNTIGVPLLVVIFGAGWIYRRRKLSRSK